MNHRGTEVTEIVPEASMLSVSLWLNKNFHFLPESLNLFCIDFALKTAALNAAVGISLLRSTPPTLGFIFGLCAVACAGSHAKAAINGADK
jgi:hypothetical protein